MNVVDNEVMAALRGGWFEIDPMNVSPLGDGHINDTRLVEKQSGERFVLQRINPDVFRDPQQLMDNLVRVLGFAREHAPGFLPHLLRTRDNAPAYVDDQGGYWRLWGYVEGTTLVAPVTVAVAQAAGAAFGGFQKFMNGFPEPVLESPIPGFLELEGYLASFDSVVADVAEPPPRLMREFVDQRRMLAGIFPAGACYIHGDCKLDNLLFREGTSNVVCVVDLDTVMRGHWAWDFGDLVRSLAGDGDIGADVFAGAARGFLAASGAQASVDELLEAPRYIALMLGIRFLTDHLSGDLYFNVLEHGENFVRAQRQFAIVEKFETHRAELARALRSVDLTGH